MQPDFWHQRWDNDETAFHLNAPHPLLIKHIAALAQAPGARFFLPLCGKTLDLGWLLQQGYRVCGAELSAKAVEQLFAQLKLTPTLKDYGSLQCWRADAIDVFVGDIFNLKAEILGTVDAIYDRAALVALPESMRIRYVEHLLNLCPNAPHLLISFDFDQTKRPGPPFSVTASEVQTLYRSRKSIQRLDRTELPSGLGIISPVFEEAWLISSTHS